MEHKETCDKSFYLNFLGKRWTMWGSGLYIDFCPFCGIKLERPERRKAERREKEKTYTLKLRAEGFASIGSKYTIDEALKKAHAWSLSDFGHWYEIAQE